SSDLRVRCVRDEDAAEGVALTRLDLDVELGGLGGDVDQGLTQHRGLGVPLLAQARFEVRLQLVPARLLEDVTLLQRQLSLEASLQLLRKASQATHLDALD